MSSTSATNRLAHGDSATLAIGASPAGGRDLEKNRRSTTLSVIVPVYNERFLIEASLARLDVLGESPLLERVRIIVVDDGSSDGTADAIARFRESREARGDSKFSWIWMRHEKNSGKGAAIRTGLQQVDTELVVIHDADLEYHPWQDLLQMGGRSSCPRMPTPSCLALPRQPLPPGAVLPPRTGESCFLTLFCNVVSDLNLTDMETCYKMVRTDLLKSIPLVSPRVSASCLRSPSSWPSAPREFLKCHSATPAAAIREGKKIGWKDGVRCIGAIVHFALSDHVYSGDETGSEILGRLNRAPRFTKWMADVIRPYLGESRARDRRGYR